MNTIPPRSTGHTLWTRLQVNYAHSTTLPNPSDIGKVSLDRPKWSATPIILAKDYIMPYDGLLIGFTDKGITPRGYIEVWVTIGDQSLSKKIRAKFLVIDHKSAYNVILGRPTLNCLEVGVSTPHLSMKSLVGPHGLHKESTTSPFGGGQLTSPEAWTTSPLVSNTSSTRQVAISLPSDDDRYFTGQVANNDPLWPKFCYPAEWEPYPIRSTLMPELAYKP
ncbi:hypothetical protein Lal_00032502 [Lupinus albus]|nr:hypothetical protein Lal_00032502 [Lupinus albus]